MASFSNFPESNFTWKGDGKEIGDLPAHKDDVDLGNGNFMSRSITCWELTDAELEEVRLTRRVWLSVYGMHPPVLIMGHNPFDDPINQKAASPVRN